MEVSMIRAPRILVLFVFSFTAIAHVLAQRPQTVQIAGFRPSLELGWQRTSPTLEQPDGPVLYQIIFRSSATPGNVPVISPTFTLMDSHIADSGAMLSLSEPVVFAGGQTFPGVLSLGGGTMTGNITFAGGQTFPGVLSLGGGTMTGPITFGGGQTFPGVLSLGGGTMTGNITFSAGQTFPASGLPDLAGEVTGPVGATVVSNAVDANTPNFIVRRDGSGSFSAGTVALSGDLVLPGTSSASSGVIKLGGSPFLHAYRSGNTFVGAGAGNFTMSGANNTAVGQVTLAGNTTGIDNSAFGYSALLSNTSGGNNTAVGISTLTVNTTGTGNTAVGYGALQNLVSGNNNIAIGPIAGSLLNAGESNNIDIGNAGMAGESNTIRIGDNSQAVFIGGITGTGIVAGAPVVSDSNGRLGVQVVSSRRFKQDIVDLGTESDILMKLRPVAFYYKPELDSTHTRQYGLVAEEVAQIAPGLVIFDRDNRPENVRYHLVNAMLLNEVQKQHRLIESQQSENQAQRKQLVAQEDEINAQQQHMQAMEEQMETLRRQNADLAQQMKAVMLRLAAMEKSGQHISTEEAALSK
jgi:hypothetical protein